MDIDNSFCTINCFSNSPVPNEDKEWRKCKVDCNIQVLNFVDLKWIYIRCMSRSCH